MATMAEVIKKYFLASLFMWMFPIAILYGFEHDWFSGFMQLSPYYQTLFGGFLAVISVNLVIVFYIWLALKEPSVKHKPDPSFVAKAKASLNQSKPGDGEKEE